MTISSTSRTAGPFTGNGVAADFPFAYKVFARSDVMVARTVTATSVETLLVLDSDYTVTLNVDQNSNPGGLIHMIAPPPVGTTLAATSNLPVQQSLDLTNQGGFYPRAINDALDRIVITIQQLAARVGVGALNVGAAATIAAILNTLTTLAGSTGSSLIGFLQAGVGAVLHTMQDKARERVSVFDFMTAVQITDAQGTTSTGSDHTAAIQAAINALNQTNKGGILFFPRGRYRTTAMLTVPWTGSGIILEGDGGLDQSGDGVSTVYGNHAQDAILNLQGSVLCQVKNLCLDGGTGATYPKTGLLLGRYGAGSAGWHVFDRVGIIGRFSVAGHYNVASEGNTYRDCFFNLDAGSTASKAVYLSGSDSGGLAPVTPLTGSTFLGAEFLNCHIYHMGLAAGISCVYIDGSVALGSIAFRGGYLVQANGHFVSIRNGTIDGKDTLGPITFDGVGGERPNGVGVPLSGFNLFAGNGAGGPVYLRGLSIRNCGFLMAAGNYILQDAYVKLVNAVILSQGVDASNLAVLAYRPSLIGSNKIGLASVNNGENLNCLIDVGSGLRVEAANQVTFTGAWGQTFSVANAFGIVSYQKDLFNNVTLEGAPGGGAANSSIFTLPVGYRPITTKKFATLSNLSSIAGQGDTTVTVNTDGTVVVTGNPDPVYLTGITFSCLR